MSDDRNHLPPPPLGYRWQAEIDMETHYYHAGLHPTSWAHLNPGKSRGFGSSFPAHYSKQEAYADLVQFAWIGVDMQRDIEELRKRHD